MNIQEVFNNSAANYDNLRRTLIPCFDDFYKTAVDVIPNHHLASFKVLDLGAGTGLYSAMVQSVFPNAEFTLVDLSSEMLEKAEYRFRKIDKIPRIIISNYVELDFDDSYDLVISALSIHHLSDIDKQSLYYKIYDVLNPGGMFINADQVLGKTIDLEKLYRQHWLNSVITSGISVEDLNAAQKRMEYDCMSPLDVQLNWLESANFQNVDCWYKNFSFAVFGGYRPI